MGKLEAPGSILKNTQRHYMLEWFDLMTSKEQNTWTTLLNVHLKPHVVEINSSVSLMRTQVIAVT